MFEHLLSEQPESKRSCRRRGFTLVRHYGCAASQQYSSSRGARGAATTAGAKDAWPKPLKAAVEVEEKFAATIEPEALEKRVRELGGEVLRTVEFYDEYFDTEDLKLTTRYTWLRRRDGAWELKIPAEASDKRRAARRRRFGRSRAFPVLRRELASLGVGASPMTPH